MSTRAVAIGQDAAASVLALLPAPAFPQERAFDLDTGNAALEVVIPAAIPPTLATWASSDASLVLRLTVMLNNAWFDAIAPYHLTAVGVSSRLGRRPASERATNRQRNIAILYASYRVLTGLLPQFEAQWREMLSGVGLDPNDDPDRDPASPVGIGTRAGEAVVASRLHDGMNQLGDEGGRQYHRQPYADYLGYRPVNTADVLLDPGRWQPDVVTIGNGIFRVQEFVTPQYGLTRPYSYGSPTEFDLPAPRDSDPVHHGGYQRQADEVLRASAALTDTEEGDRRALQRQVRLAAHDRVLPRGDPAVHSGRVRLPRVPHQTGRVRHRDRRVALQAALQRGPAVQRDPPPLPRPDRHRVGRPRAGYRHRPARRAVAQLPEHPRPSRVPVGYGGDLRGARPGQPAIHRYRRAGAVGHDPPRRLGGGAGRHPARRHCARALAHLDPVGAGLRA